MSRISLIAPNGFNAFSRQFFRMLSDLYIEGMNAWNSWSGLNKSMGAPGIEARNKAVHLARGGSPVSAKRQGGGNRLLGVPVVEDKIVQMALDKILGAIC